ncbi:MAG TPA: hypothetical protein VI757_05890 [Bacteroidia bacterium]|nr:hypothetical protein [Bacteroidia bacterium]
MPRKKAIFFPSIIGNIGSYLQNVSAKLGAAGSGLLADKYNTPAALLVKLGGWLTSLPDAINKAFADAQTAQQSYKTQNDLIADIQKDVLKEFNRIADEENFDEGDMIALGARVSHEPIDENTVKPRISKITVLMTMVILDWVKGRMQGVIIYGSYDGITWTEIGRDFKSPFEDMRSNRTPGTAEIRYYKMRYMKDDKAIGLETDVVKVVVDIA